MSPKYYITTAIDYGNAAPHLGHASEKVYADCAARWRRMQGDDVFFLTGTDENAQKVYKAAKDKCEDPRTFVAHNAERFQELCSKLGITNDQFIRTTEPRHKRAAQHAFQTVFDKGDIYKGTYKGFYCNGCEAYFNESDLVDGCCPTHKTKCELLEEENYFFKMSKYRDRLLERFKNCPDFIVPGNRTDEILNRVKSGLEDLSVSRPTKDWGISLPMDENHVIYVWFDALINYLSGIGYPDEGYRNHWPADAHVIGKDIIWFHAVIWPCMLMAMDMELPKHIYVHGFWLSGSEKMSKSTGNTIDPFKILDDYGADTFRYFLLRETAFGQDGNYTDEALVSRRDTELANELSNLLHRVLSMLAKYNDSVVPQPGTPTEMDEDLIAVAKRTPAAMSETMADFRFSVALEEIWKLVRRANKYVEETTPWTLAKEGNTERLNTVLYNLCESARLISVLIEPFIPQTAVKMREQLSWSGTDNFGKDTEWGVLIPGTTTSRGEPLFLRIEQ